MLGGAKSRLEEGGAQGFDAAFAHPGLSFPLATLLKPWIVAHEGVEPGGDFAVVSGAQDFAGKVSEDFGGSSGTKARHGFHERFGLWIDALGGEGFDLLSGRSGMRSRSVESNETQAQVEVQHLLVRKEALIGRFAIITSLRPGWSDRDGHWFPRVPCYFPWRSSHLLNAV